MGKKGHFLPWLETISSHWLILRGSKAKLFQMEFIIWFELEISIPSRWWNSKTFRAYKSKCAQAMKGIPLHPSNVPFLFQLVPLFLSLEYWLLSGQIRTHYYTHNGWSTLTWSNANSTRGGLSDPVIDYSNCLQKSVSEDALRGSWRSRWTLSLSRERQRVLHIALEAHNEHYHPIAFHCVEPESSSMDWS